MKKHFVIGSLILSFAFLAYSGSTLAQWGGGGGGGCVSTGPSWETFTCSDTFTVPDYDTLTVEMWGGGGGGGGAGWRSDNNAGNGGDSSFNSPTLVVAGGGKKGLDRNNGGLGGAGGTFSGGSAGDNGDNGGTRANKCSGKGGDAGDPGGGNGGAKVCPSPYKADGKSGSSPGGGGSGGNQANYNDGGGGGGGAYVTKTFAAGELEPGSTIAVAVGGGGARGQGGDVGDIDGGAGARGEVRVTWTTNALPPTCTITVDQNPIPPGGSTTLRWESTDADWFYITNVGYVNSPGSTLVSPSDTTVYDGTVGGLGGEGACSRTLVVGSGVATSDLVANNEVDDNVDITLDTAIPFNWSSTNTSDCTITYTLGAPWSGSTTGTSGPSRDVTFSSTGTFTYTLACTGDGIADPPDDVVTVAVSSDVCTDIPNAQPSVPPGCTGPNPSPVGACIPSGHFWNGSQCVLDVCTDIFGGQTSVPPGCTGPDPIPAGMCVPAGYEWNGSECVLTSPALPDISSFYGDRVRSGETSALHWTMNNFNDDLTCVITPHPTGGASYTVTLAQGSVETSPVTQPKLFTLTCDNGIESVSVTAAVILLPVFQEI